MQRDSDPARRVCPHMLGVCMSTPSRGTQTSFNVLSWFSSVGLILLGTAHCTNTPSDASTVSPDAVGQVQTLVAADPTVPYFATVVANGTGCEAGTTLTTISTDGTTFVTTFSAYEVMVDPGQLISIKDCQLGIKLHTPQGFSFSVQSFFYQGFAFLEPGVVGRQTANYYFAGDPVDAAEARTDLVGKYDDDYLFTDKIGVADLVWSKCGVERDLQVVTRLRAQNDKKKTGTGYMNLTSVDGSTKLVLTLAWKKC
jgi:hypothetical protein